MLCKTIDSTTIGLCVTDFICGKLGRFFSRFCLSGGFIHGSDLVFSSRGKEADQRPKRAKEVPREEVAELYVVSFSQNYN